MKKITIRRKDYGRTKRHFLKHDEPLKQDREIEQTTDETIPADESRQEETHQVVHHETTQHHQRNHLWKYLLGLLGALLLGGLLSLLLMNMLNDKKQSSVNKLTTEQVIKASKKSVVSVINHQKSSNLLTDTEAASTPEEVGIGSGVVYKLTDSQAYIITNYHVIKDAATIEVKTADNEQLIAKVKGADQWTDLAVITVDGKQLKDKLSFADSDKVEAGQTAIAIGSPLDQAFAGSVSKGIISGTNRSVPVDLDGDGIYDWEANVLQTDAAINPGNSGGALIDSQGRLIGVNAMKISLDNVEGISFAIPSNEVKEIAATLETKGKIKRPTLGVEVQDIQSLALDAVRKQIQLPESVEQGVVVTMVTPGSAAETAGLTTKDVITQLDDTKIDSLVTFRRVLYYDKKIGEQLKVTFYRNGKQMTKSVKLK